MGRVWKWSHPDQMSRDDLVRELRMLRAKVMRLETEADERKLKEVNG